MIDAVEDGGEDHGAEEHGANGQGEEGHTLEHGIALLHEDAVDGPIEDLGAQVGTQGPGGQLGQDLGGLGADRFPRPFCQEGEYKEAEDSTENRTVLSPFCPNEASAVGAVIAEHAED